ncbi:PREDICTED: uncharacterized protein LOC109181757 [Ipomoea nil]|uniref:uncharacterized protein LOC109181757 n=1 Tax=Ipomoea nil TaxID=35883 RepID=UPI000900FCDC|nr:PREDICTED: uncharacterized protein LOC109181757 [Ipomoea nil]
MVSERGRSSYAAVVMSSTGDSGQRTHPSTPPANRSPNRSTPSNNLQRTLTPQRSNRSEDIDNPLFLNSNENTNAVLVSPPLTGSANYGTWSVSMRVALEVKNKWAIVEGTTVAPDRNHAQYPAWRRCNLMICAWIYKAVHPSIAQSVMHIQNAREVWNDLKKRFSQRDAHRISSLHMEIQNLRQGDMSVNDYYTRCRILWEQMNELRPLPICRCVPQCSCNAFDEIRNEKEVDQIIRFLQGLNEEYNSLKSGILVLDPMPDLHKVLVMAEKFERQLKIESLSLGHIEVNHANAVQTNPTDDQEVVAAVGYNSNRRNNGFGTGNKSAKCTYCGMTGHTIEKCYKKHGYPPPPPGWVPGFKSRGKQQATAAVSTLNEPNTNEQLQKLISLLQVQIGQNHPTSAAVTLTKSSPDEVSSSKQPWEADWFC